MSAFDLALGRRDILATTVVRSLCLSAKRDASQRVETQGTYVSNECSTGSIGDDEL